MSLLVLVWLTLAVVNIETLENIISEMVGVIIFPNDLRKISAKIENNFKGWHNKVKHHIIQPRSQFNGFPLAS
jgi:hypothetical protein